MEDENKKELGKNRLFKSMSVGLGLGSAGLIGVPFYAYVNELNQRKNIIVIPKDAEVHNIGTKEKKLIIITQKDYEISSDRPASYRNKPMDSYVLVNEGYFSNDRFLYKNRIRIDKRGFRNPPEYDNINKFPIIFVGDSFVDQNNLKEEDLSSSKFKKITGLLTYNMGLTQSGPADQLDMIKKLGVKLEPNVIFWCIFGGNDFEPPKPLNYDFLMKGYEFEYEKWTKYTIRSNQNKENKKIKKIEDRKYNRNEMQYLYQPYTVHAVDGAWKRIKTIFEEAFKLCNDNNIKLEVFYIPVKGEVYPSSGLESFWENKEIINGPILLEDLCKSNNIGFTNLKKRFKESKELTYMPLDTHLTETGHRILAEIAAEIIKEKYPDLLRK